MARKFGGRFSPGGANDDPGGAQGDQRNAAGVPTEARGRGVSLRVRLMFVAPLPLIFTGFSAISQGDAGGVLRLFGALAIFELAAWLLMEGDKAKAAFDARAIARKPAFPRKIFAALFCGGATALAMGGGAALPLAVGLLATLLHLAAFGIDPLKSKGIEGYENFDNRRAALAVEEAEAYLREMEAALAPLQDRALSERLGKFTQAARAMFREVEADPRDLGAARKYLGVYLMGARDAARKYAELAGRDNAGSDQRGAYLRLLDDLEQNFQAQSRELLLDDQTDLDIEIDLLRDRLRQEGIAPV